MITYRERLRRIREAMSALDAAANQTQDYKLAARLRAAAGELIDIREEFKEVVLQDVKIERNER
jgi:hypothetical protein